MIIAQTERLILRKFRPSDLDDLHEYLSDAEVVEFEPYPPMSRQEAAAELERRIATDEMTAVELKSNHKLIGNIYLGTRDFESVEIGYVFNRAFWGNGYAKEACLELIRIAFASGTHRIFAECDPKNTSSWRLLESLGFVREAYFRKNVYFRTDADGKPVWKDTYVYSMLNEGDASRRIRI